jgi:hypothetical protein
LTGETLNVSLNSAPYWVDQCTSPGQPPPSYVKTEHFSLRGTAAGPYPGSFHEDGSVTFAADQPGNPGEFDGMVTAYAVKFTITSPRGFVTGIETSGDSAPAPVFSCFFGISGKGFQASPAPSYTARIIAPHDGIWRDTGTNAVTLTASQTNPGLGGGGHLTSADRMTSSGITRLHKRYHRKVHRQRKR